MWRAVVSADINGKRRDLYILMNKIVLWNIKITVFYYIHNYDIIYAINIINAIV